MPPSGRRVTGTATARATVRRVNVPVNRLSADIVFEYSVKSKTWLHNIKIRHSVLKSRNNFVF